MVRLKQYAEEGDAVEGVDIRESRIRRRDNMSLRRAQEQNLTNPHIMYNNQQNIPYTMQHNNPLIDVAVMTVKHTQ